MAVVSQAKGHQHHEVAWTWWGGDTMALAGKRQKWYMQEPAGEGVIWEPQATTIVL